MKTSTWYKNRPRDTKEGMKETNGLSKNVTHHMYPRHTIITQKGDLPLKVDFFTLL